jgi:nitroimidazol reductase NimA-like FMN-containing flavoprotein (pyridoxamine 5'-phosphate oxidase superfamily)
MANHIPQGIDPSATGNTGGNRSFAPPYIFDKDAEVNFTVHKVQEATKKKTFYKNKRIEFTLEDCEVWEFGLILKDEHDNSNYVWHDVVKDGRAWDVKDKNGKPYIQNKFINMCTGMGLRKSQEKVNINPAWFTDVSFFTLVQGICKVDKYVAQAGKNQGKYQNSINWFVESNNYAPNISQQVMHDVTNQASTSGASVEPFASDANEVDEEDGIPF